MKTKFKIRHTLFASGGFFFALLLSPPAHVYAEDTDADKPRVQSKEEETFKRNEEPIRSGTTRDLAQRVGPSGEEIHDFLYPTREDDKVLTRAN